MVLKRAACGLMLTLALGVATEACAQAQSVPSQSVPKKKRPVRKPSKELQAILAEEARQAAEARAQAEARAKAEQASLKAREAEQEGKARAAQEARVREAARITAQEAEAAQKTAAGRNSLMQEATALMRAGKPAEAHALLEPQEFEQAGDAPFDYLLGNAALESGKPEQATLAFERVLAVNPAHAGARLDMARAYYQLGDLASAREEFGRVMKLDPPGPAREMVRKYLDVIDAQLNPVKRRVTGYIEGMAGRDTNINSATNQTSIPVFNNTFSITLSADSVKTTDNFSGLAAGVEGVFALGNEVSWYAGAEGRSRTQIRNGQFNGLNLDGRTGVVWVLGRQDSVRAGLLAGGYSLGSEHYRDNAGVNGEWTHVFSPSSQMSVFGQRVNYRFVDANLQSQDFNQGVVGVGLMYSPQDRTSMLFSSLYHGQESDVDPVSASNPSGGRVDGGKQFSGIRAGIQGEWNARVDLFIGAGAVAGNYGRLNSIFQVNRRDRQFDVMVGGNWHWDRNWSLRPQISWTRNCSNILIYRYERLEALLAIRRDFN